MLGNISSPKGLSILEQAAHGSGGVTIPGRIYKKTCRRGA